MTLQDLKTHIDDLRTSMEERFERIEGVMATKDDIANMATKDDIVNMATKDDIVNMATKDDIVNMATKDDIGRLERRLLENRQINIQYHLETRKLIGGTERRVTALGDALSKAGDSLHEI